MSEKDKYILLSALAFTVVLVYTLLDIAGTKEFGWIGLAVGFLVFVPATVYYFHTLDFENKKLGFLTDSVIYAIELEINILRERIEQLEFLIIEARDKNNHNIILQ